jgi:hypothetical protein
MIILNHKLSNGMLNLHCKQASAAPDSRVCSGGGRKVILVYFSLSSFLFSFIYFTTLSIQAVHTSGIGSSEGDSLGTNASTRGALPKIGLEKQ